MLNCISAEVLFQLYIDRSFFFVHILRPCATLWVMIDLPPALLHFIYMPGLKLPILCPFCIISPQSICDLWDFPPESSTFLLSLSQSTGVSLNPSAENAESIDKSRRRVPPKVLVLYHSILITDKIYPSKTSPSGKRKLERYRGSPLPFQSHADLFEFPDEPFLFCFAGIWSRDGGRKRSK